MPVDEVFQVIRSNVNMYHIFIEHSILKNYNIMDLLNICMRAAYFLFENKYYQQKEGVECGYGKPVSPVVSNIFMNTEKADADQPSDSDTFVVCKYGPQRLQEFIHCISSLRPTI